MSSTSPLIPIEHRTVHEGTVTLPRTAEQAAWIEPAIIAACVLVVAILATWVVARTLRKHRRLRRTLIALSASVAVLAAVSSLAAQYLSTPDVRPARGTSEEIAAPDFSSLFGSKWTAISNDTLHKRIEQRYGLDVPDRYLDRIQRLTSLAPGDEPTGPIRVVGQDGSDIRECNVWTTRDDPVTIALHCD